jgi:hypothetical protein
VDKFAVVHAPAKAENEAPETAAAAAIPSIADFCLKTPSSPSYELNRYVPLPVSVESTRELRNRLGRLVFAPGVLAEFERVFGEATSSLFEPDRNIAGSSRSFGCRSRGGDSSPPLTALE